MTVPRAAAVSLDSTSRATDAGFLALADLAQIATDLAVDYRIVGGHMVTLLVAAHHASHLVPTRETLDADFGALPQVIADPRLVLALRDLGYAPVGAANRFVRTLLDPPGPLDLVVDILAPSYVGRLLPNQRHGDLIVDEVPGLASALARPPVVVQLTVRLLHGGSVETTLALPDLVGALCIKALAYRGRYSDKDAVDLWRLLNAAHVAGIRPGDWPSTITGQAAATVLWKFFGRTGAAGLRQACRQRSEQTHLRAIVRAVVPVL